MKTKTHHLLLGIGILCRLTSMVTAASPQVLGLMAGFTNYTRDKAAYAQPSA
jgi:hypothetical protein